MGADLGVRAYPRERGGNFQAFH
ncbi:hypothetical protein NTGHW29_150001 [Candidatus Nitrotoga sp. HW29]|nr:hypothetical protein NTGHW29_150001 [Candidatus Nitrotoga sp. HW29]